MQGVLLIDIGSTYTKVTAVDLEEPRILGGAAAYTTVQTDVSHGLISALRKLQEITGPLTFTKRFACSSAAGGLKMIASGLAPSLTETAAKMACLGAGAKVIRSYAYKLTQEDIEEILQLAPDIFLLTGGTDGGNEQTILHNAKLLGAQKPSFPIVLAGNRNAKAQCLEYLASWAVYPAENVLPRLENHNVGPAQEKIRDLFLERIVRAKGLSEIADQMDLPLIPTPSAVLLAMELLADGTKNVAGIGELVAVDLGGATTDIYSVAQGAPSIADAQIKGLPEPYVKRTVEGDIGMRYSAADVVGQAGLEEIAQLSRESPEAVRAWLETIEKEPDVLAASPGQIAIDRAIAAMAVKIAVSRHAGHMEEAYTVHGPVNLQYGKDLTGVKNLILTGGAIVHNKDAGEIAKYALYDKADPNVLRPKEAKVYIDKKYILASMGLLAQKYPDVAQTLMKKEIYEYGTK